MFTNRTDAGLRLAKELLSYRGAVDLVIGLARGGVVVSAALSKVLHIPHDVLVVKKIGSPGNPEFAIGARVPEGQLLDVRNKTVILTDDGAATGATMEAAIRWVCKHNAKKIIVALPVAPPEIAAKLQTLAGDVIVLETPSDFGAVGQFYRDFTQVTDEDVVQLLS
ncbi:MAG: phosphoribosyltransferase family protein [Candidatus Gottesmanbacteria bacterium]|nr:phosphoribosyltransferase family protein [Candidatus Gottesmanbacteria bacterium]